MFRLNDAVRCYQAQHQSQSETRRVATLSPRARPRMKRVVATVATPPLAPADIALLIEQLREEGARLEHQENALLIRPTHWQQVDRFSPHWKALLLFLQTNENGDDDDLD
ncbi:hypothetical protein CS390_21090 [Pseudomonas sp. HLS-6]|uniref:hypothetical protein n=1 Tax=Pseudomonas sp. HLS-6 TaxID=2049589 RepID=UPI000C194C88|nr:hypothetical protein [Pseudomonas sp. HLS-6]ATR84838.1 hypothetical protein CS390_21090 [Pseudomonas sp. HLS-6]